MQPIGINQRMAARGDDLDILQTGDPLDDITPPHRIERPSLLGEQQGIAIRIR